MNKLFFALIILSLASCNRNSMKYDASGTFEATEVTVSAEATGRIMSLTATEGERLEAGVQVGLIDTTQLYYSLVQAQRNVKATDSRAADIAKQIAATQVQIATQQRDRVRIENLVKAKAANTKQLDDIDSAIEVLQKQLAAQQSTLERSNTGVSESVMAAITQVAQIQDQLSKCRIKSPINGTVLMKYAEAGDFATTGKPIFKIADMVDVYLRAYVTSDQLSSIKLGQKAKVFADYGEKTQEYEGMVTWISDNSEFTPKTILTKDERANLVYAVKIAVVSDGGIKLGMYGQVIF